MQQLSSLQLAFELPPPAIHDAAADASRISPVDSKQQQLSPLSTPSLGLDNVATSPKTVVYPMQAAETVKSRRRSSAATTKEPKENTFALPPPPTRSRKIIQMKPRTQDTAAASASTKESSARAAGKAAAAKTAAPGPDAGAGAGGASAKGESTKKKQPSATSAAGRKIARKTAHSLIERRRRSKMNEEFALLKSMIPACTGEMHKLAILQVCSLPPESQKTQIQTKPSLTHKFCRLPLNMSAIWKTASPSSRPSKSNPRAADPRPHTAPYHPSANSTQLSTRTRQTSK